jgi:hypothetical protein
MVAPRGATALVAATREAYHAAQAPAAAPELARRSA